jgi:class 3 adenylate cyclase
MEVHEGRKLVSVVFCDLVESTALAGRLDPETVRGLLGRYYETARTVLERHGGTVEKFIGDAVVGLFGVPTLREDDATRAVRGAAELVTAMDALNGQLAASSDVHLAVRVGVNSGAMLVRSDTPGEARAFGDAVNIAARLQQAAAPGEVLIGEGTLELVRDAVVVVPVAPIAAKGKPEPIAAARLVEVLTEMPAFERPLRTRLVGRVAELERLRALAAATCDGDPRLVTVIGEPGLGKSRLLRELIVGAANGSAPLVGRCLHYGDGITYWPLAEILRQLDRRGGVGSVVAGDPDEALIRSRLGAVRGADVVAAAGEIGWAARRLFERLAGEPPLIVVFDDIHWAEPAMLDLIEYLAATTRAGVLFACAARPELLDLRPAWAAPQPHSDLVTIAALSAEETRQLSNIAASAALDESVIERVVSSAAGNPLFVEQLVAAAEDGSLDAQAPPRSIQVLLASRIDQLPASERDVLTRGSVEGRLFHRGAIVALQDQEPVGGVDAALLSLVRKQFVRPDRSEFPGDDGYRFAHALVRDAAYDAAPKALLATLHERYADWLEARVGEAVADVEEILGYHLERAYLLRETLDRADADRATAMRAARHLMTAARRANDRWDSTAVLHLLRRARPLLEDDPAWLDVAVPYASAMSDEEIKSDAVAELTRTVDAAEHAGRWDVAQRARLLRSMIVGGAPDLDGLRREAEDVIARIDPDEDPATATAAWRNLAYHGTITGDPHLTERAGERSLAIARKASLPKMTSVALGFYLWAVVPGPTPARDGIRRCRELWDPENSQPADQVRLHGALSWLYAMCLEDAEARACVDAVLELQERRGESSYRDLENMVGPALVLLGDLTAAEDWFRSCCDDLRARGQLAVWSTTAAYLGHVLADQGVRLDEADELCRESERLTDSGDRLSEILTRSLRAKLLLAADDSAGARVHARAAVEFAEMTKWPSTTADVLVVLAAAARSEGDAAAMTDALDRATMLYHTKGNLAGEQHANRLRGIAVPSPRCSWRGGYMS